jgi:hypothetical protein
MAYAYAFSPLVNNSDPFTGGLAHNQFQLHFPRNTSASDLTYNIQASPDLSLWTNLLTYAAATGWVTNVPGVAISESAPNGAPPNQSVNVTATTSTNVTQNTAGQFLRLQVHR